MAYYRRMSGTFAVDGRLGTMAYPLPVCITQQGFEQISLLFLASITLCHHFASFLSILYEFLAIIYHVKSWFPIDIQIVILFFIIDWSTRLVFMEKLRSHGVHISMDERGIVLIIQLRRVFGRGKCEKIKIKKFVG